MKNAPFGLQLIYLLNCYLNLLNCLRVVRIRLRSDWMFMRVELKKGNEHLPQTRAFAVINLSIAVTFFVAFAHQVIFYIITSDLQQEKTWSSSTPPLIFHDIIYLLQLLSSRRSPDTFNSMTLIMSAYVGKLMCNLPWRLIAVKGFVKLAELVLFDVLEYPSIKVVTFVRDDFVMVVSYVFYYLSIDNVRSAHTGKAYQAHEIPVGKRKAAAESAGSCEYTRSSSSYSYPGRN
jgi:hypothetical protein